MHFLAVSCKRNTLLGENYLTRATLPGESALIRPCNFHPSTQTIPQFLTLTSLLTVSGVGNTTMRLWKQNMDFIRRLKNNNKNHTKLFMFLSRDSIFPRQKHSFVKKTGSFHVNIFPSCFDPHYESEVKCKLFI